MGIIVADNFSYQGSKPLDARTKYATIELMKAQAETTLFDGCLAFVDENEKTYQFKSSNTVDETLGRWREFSSGGGSGTSDYSELVNKPQIEGITLSGNKTASDLGLAKTSDLSNFITKAVDDLINYYTKTQTYTKAEVDTIVTNIKNSRFEVVSTLPTSDIKTNVIYLVPSSSATISNVKDEYINLDGTSSGWEVIGSTDVDLSNYVTTTDLNTALSNYVTSANLTTILSGYATTTQLNNVKENQRQTVTYIPPSASMHGEIWQYMGADMTGAPFLKSGFFYRCDYEGQGVYKWTNVNVQPSSGGSTVTVTQIQATGTKIAEIDVDGSTTEIYAPTSGGGSGHTIENASGTELTQRDTLQFGEGFKVTDDSTNEKTKVDLDKLATGELDDIFDDLPPAVEPAYHNYSTVEHKVGTWIDGKPIYQKTLSISLSDLTNENDMWYKNVDVSSLEIDTAIDCDTSIKGANMVRTLPLTQATSVGFTRFGSVFLNNATTVAMIFMETNSTMLDSLKASTAYVTIQYTKTTDTI